MLLCRACIESARPGVTEAQNTANQLLEHLRMCNCLASVEAAVIHSDAKADMKNKPRFVKASSILHNHA
jgi:hypothetical protein